MKKCFVFSVLGLGLFLTACARDVPFEDYCSPVFSLCNDDFPQTYQSINLPKIQGDKISGSFGNYNINSITHWLPQFILLYGSGSTYFSVVADTSGIMFNQVVLDSTNVLDGNSFSYNLGAGINYNGDEFSKCFILRYSDGKGVVEGHFFAQGTSYPSRYKKEGYRSYYTNGEIVESIGKVCSAEDIVG